MYIYQVYWSVVFFSWNLLIWIWYHGIVGLIKCLKFLPLQFLRDINNDVRMASLTRWTWVWVNSGSWWWTGRPGVLRFMRLQRVGHDWATDLIWSDLILQKFKQTSLWLFKVFCISIEIVKLFVLALWRILMVAW